METTEKGRRLGIKIERAGLHALLLFCVQSLMMNLSGIKDNTVAHVLNISGILTVEQASHVRAAQ